MRSSGDRRTISISTKTASKTKEALLLSRREFCVFAGAAFSNAAISSQLQGPAGPAGFNVDSIDRTRVLRAASVYLRQRPITITAFHSRRSAGGLHDYFSEGDYWWPNPKDPGGPYIRRDGMSNPDNFTAHREALIRFSMQMPALTAAWVLTRDSRYAEHAEAHLRAWFVDAATRMNPNLQYAQAIHGITTGRGIGIIDTVQLVEVARAAARLSKGRAMHRAMQAGIHTWFADYLQWMTTSKNGIDERNAKNNHGTCWALQAAEFAQLTGSHSIMRYAADRYKTVLLPEQMKADGSFPRELARTKPYSYSLFNLDVMTTLCKAVSSPDDNVLTYQLPDGRGIRKAIAFMYPFIKNKKAWPYPPDVEYFNDLPVRQPSLLFGGLAFSQPKYLALWQTLNPDPTVPEIIRNFPIRQPVLWL